MKVLIRFEDGHIEVLTNVYMISFIQIADRYYYDFKYFSESQQSLLVRYDKRVVREMEIYDK